jgi:hypothetical protein
MLFVRRRPLLPGIALAGVLVATGIAFQKKDDPKQADKLDQAQRQEVQVLIQAVDAAMAGQIPASDVTLGVRTDFLKAMEGKTYVPFVVSVESGALKPTVAMYLRVAPKGMNAPPPPSASSGKKDEKAAKDPRPAYPFEDVHFVELKPAAAAAPAPATPAPKPTGKAQLTRAFAVGPGEYDVYLAVRERGPVAPPPPAGTSGAAGGQPAAATVPAPKLVVHKHTVTVPDYWNNELNTSSVILADKVQQLTSAPAKDQQAEHPYALGTTDIVPAADPKFTKAEELNVIFLIYNPSLNAEKKPDVTVEYSFHQKTGETEKYFNRTPPQTFGAGTLPPNFDLAAGHQLVAGQSVPLATFPDGDYRLEIKVTDNIAQKTITRDVTFSVAP